MEITLRRRLRAGITYKRMKSTSNHSAKARTHIRDKDTQPPKHRTLTYCGLTGRSRWG